jgi:hypothetical protein
VSEEVSDLVKQVLEHWRSSEAAPLAPCTERQLRDFEHRKHAHLPYDLRQFLLVANGMNRGFRLGKDSEGFAFWNLADFRRADVELRQRSPSSPRPENGQDFYTFADYMDWSWAYAIKLCGDGTGCIALIGGADAVPLVASSFSDFLQKYLHDPERLLTVRGSALDSRRV